MDVDVFQENFICKTVGGWIWTKGYSLPTLGIYFHRIVLYVNTHMSTPLHVHIYEYIYICIHIYFYVYKYRCLVHVCISIRICMCVCIHQKILGKCTIRRVL